MNLRHKRAYLRCAKRKNVTSCWEFLWRENGPQGKRMRRTAVIGTVEQYPTEEIDFLIPSLIGLNLMASGMWGLGLAIVSARG